MTSGNAQPFLNDPDVSRERIELETRVLAAALRQSLELGDTEGSSLAHRQIFNLLKASQEMGWEEPISLPPELVAQKSKPLPDIDWGVADEQIKAAPEPPHDDATILAPADETMSSGPQVPTPLNLAPLESANFAPGAENAQEISSISGQYRAQIPPAPLPGAHAAPPAAHSPETGAAGRAKAPIFSFLDFEQKKIDDGKPSFYTMIGVPESVDAKTVHCAFLSKVRVIVRRWAMENPVGAARREMQAGLQKLWIAHDILMDPVTRADYDLRRNGYRQGEDTSLQPKAIREQVRIGELLRCAELLEVTELEIAADMHKAMPEIMFGTFLVKQGFIEDRDLDCVLLGQKLIKNGVIVVQQFQEAMHWRANATGEPRPDLGDLLLEKGLISEEQLEQAYREQVEETIPRVPVVAAESLTMQSKSGSSSKEIAEGISGAVEVEPEEEIKAPDSSQNSSAVQVQNDSSSQNQEPLANARTEAPQNPALENMSTLAKLTNSYSSVPSVRLNSPQPVWKDHLDWGSPDEPSQAEAYSAETAQSNQADGATLAPDATPVAQVASDVASGEAGKKSLFDLMEGLKGASPEISEPLPEDVVLMSSVLNKAQEVAESPNSAAAEAKPAIEAVSKEQAYDVFPDFKTGTATGGAVEETIADDEVAALPDHDELAMDEEMSALDAAAEEALFEEVQDIDEIEVGEVGEVSGRPASADEITAEDLEAVRAPASGVELTTSPELPALSSARPGHPNEPDKNSTPGNSANESGGEWKIVSLPAAEIASLFLGDKEEKSDKNSSGAASGEDSSDGGSDSASDPDHDPGQDPGHKRRRKR